MNGLKRVNSDQNDHAKIVQNYKYISVSTTCSVQVQFMHEYNRGVFFWFYSYVRYIYLQVFMGTVGYCKSIVYIICMWFYIYTCTFNIFTLTSSVRGISVKSVLIGSSKEILLRLDHSNWGWILLPVQKYWCMYIEFKGYVFTKIFHNKFKCFKIWNTDKCHKHQY